MFAEKNAIIAGGTSITKQNRKKLLLMHNANKLNKNKHQQFIKNNQSFTQKGKLSRMHLIKYFNFLQLYRTEDQQITGF